MKITDEMIQEFKDIYKEKEKKEITDSEAHKAASQLIGFYELLLDVSIRETKLKVRLKREPGGFPVDGDYTCSICHNRINETNGWYDWYGQSCLTCKKAILDGVIPPFVCWHRGSYFLMWELKSTFSIHPQTARKYIRDGKLIARNIENENGGNHEYIFLKKENPKLIEKYNPIRKSYDRHREKISSKLVREQKEKMSKEAKKRFV